MIFNLVFLFIIALSAATLSGLAGFGGALLLLPVLSGIVGIKAAIPILTIGQLFGNASRVWFGRKELQWKPIICFLLAAIPLTMIGSYCFTSIDANKIKTGIGILLIAIVVYKRLGNRKIKLGNRGMALGGGLTGFLSGIAGSGGPLGALFFLGLNLSATSYIASEAFTALVMHLTKTMVYSKYLLIGIRELYFGLFIGLAMILGSWFGKLLLERITKEKFMVFVEVLLIVSGSQMIYDGLY